jgi:hypothetical protein
LGAHPPRLATAVVGQARVIMLNAPADRAFRVQVWWGIKKVEAPVGVEGTA